MKVLKLYAKASGLCVNIDKTKVVWIGSMKNSNVRFCENYDLQWEKNLKDMVDLNYNDKLMEIRKLLLNWSKRLLTPLGRITVIKSLALSKVILALPTPSKKILNELQKMVYGYLWNKGPDKIKWAVVIQNYENGGLRLTEVDTFMKSLKLTWLRRILLTKNNITILYMQTFPA